MKLFATDVFTPNQFPEHTYIERPKEDLERKLRNALATPNVVVSISGPSKSGKTVLAKRLVGGRCRIDDEDTIAIWLKLRWV
jgi:archaellum biogenesis ATPase FlaH